MKKTTTTTTSTTTTTTTTAQIENMRRTLWPFSRLEPRKWRRVQASLKEAQNLTPLLAVVVVAEVVRGYPMALLLSARKSAPTLATFCQHSSPRFQ